ncbi:MAG: hypothetical protein HY828_18190 [Actinobacteria bacterium]|nr:hypothetical protein [Actinomycetota bacterium]
MAAQAWFSSGDVDVAPGTTAVLQLTVVNLSDTTDSFVLTPVGMPAGWTTLRPANLTLFGGTQQIIDVEVAPPMLPSTTAGPTALSVRIVPQHDPDNLTTAETTLIIGESFDRRLNVLQPALRGRRTATYDMMLENRGNTQASCRLHLVDPSGRIEGEFDPPAAGVEPGASTLVRLKVHTTGMQWQRHPRTVPFRIDADQPGSPTATSPATFVQTPVIPENLIGRLVAAGAALAVLAVAWVGLVKPAIDDAAQAAVDKAVPTQSTTLDSSPDAGSESTVVTTPVDDKGTIVNIPLPVSVPQGQSGANQYTVPAGKVLRVTDLIVQNPQVDNGTLVVSKDGNALFTYSFAPMFGLDVDQPLVTPLELAANQQLTVTVTCDGVSDLTATACNANVFVSGRLVDA